ncbi:MAG: iron ABC transporter permease [Methanomassiliicoccaceae archaeon]|nr:iron ABC transporter permease [Methanomassiliicoccaceae archaeon]
MVHEQIYGFVEKYCHENHKKIVFTITCLILAIFVFFLTISIGKYELSFGESYRIFVDNLFGNGQATTENMIIWEYRVPRALMGIFVGASLAVGGAVMQNLMMNPLAEPYTMGISSGAFLGAVLSITCGISIIPFLGGDDATVLNAFILSLAPVFLIVAISKFRKTTPTTMILCGVAIMYAFSSVSTMLMVLADPEHLSDAYSWRVGVLGKASWDSLMLVTPSMTILIAILLLFAGKINTMSIGDKGAISLGTDPYRTRLVCLVLVALLTAFAVSFTGTIGFVGLVAPHIVRTFIGSNNTYLLPACAGFGGIFLLVMDSIAKVISETGLPVGVISAMVGGPLFIYILVQRKRRIWY